MPRKRTVKVKLNKPRFVQVKNFISVFKTQQDKVLFSELEWGSEQFAKNVVTILLRQKYKWKPLSKRYLAWKKRKGLDSRILIATKTYVQSIRAVPRKRKGKVVSWSVGPGHHNAKHRPSGMRLHQLARLLEYGTRKMPARPHWRPAWSVFVRQDKKLLARNIKEELLKRSKK